MKKSRVRPDAAFFEVEVDFYLKLVFIYCCRRAGIGMGILKVLAATPIPPSQVLGGVVQVPLPWHSAAQNMKPSMPAVVPAPAGATVCTQPPAAFWSDAAKLTHSG